MNRQQGFTLIELMTTIGVGAILVSLAVPGMRALTLNSAHRSGVNELVAGMHLARNTAITTNSRVTLCASSNGTNCEAVSWQSGWIAFTDLNSNQLVDGTEAVIRASEAHEGLTIRSTEFPRFMVYRPSGRLMNGATATNVGDFTICDERGAEHAKVISIQLSGRPQVAEKQSNGLAPNCG